MRNYAVKTRKFLAGALAVLLLLSLCACGGEKLAIDKDAATEIALAQLDGATLKSIELTTLDGLRAYSGVLTKDGTEYRVYIDADTGIVLRFGTKAELEQQDADSQNSVSGSGSIQSSSESSGNSGYIGEDAAVAACLAEYPTGVENSVSLTEYGGKPAYAVSITADGSTFTLYVDAVTGDMLS